MKRRWVIRRHTQRQWTINSNRCQKKHTHTCERAIIDDQYTIYKSVDSFGSCLKQKRERISEMWQYLSVFGSIYGSLFFFGCFILFWWWWIKKMVEKYKSTNIFICVCLKNCRFLWIRFEIDKWLMPVADKNDDDEDNRRRRRRRWNEIF